MNKPFEIITEEMWNILINKGFRREDFNKLIQEKGQVGHTSVSEVQNVLVNDRCDSIHSVQEHGDTHEALVFTRPIEAVEPDCSHVTIGLDGHNSVKTFKYCPLCGQDLSKIGDGK